MTDALTIPIDPAAETVVAEEVSFEEFLRRFAEQQAEWHMGKVFLVTNNTRHQEILVLLTTLLNLFLSARGIGRLLLAGVPMRLGEGQPVREPDVMVVLNAHQDHIRPNYLDGAADVVVEIVSPESSRRDRGDKLSEYEAAAIPEYWLIDPLRTEAVVYALGGDGRYHPISIQPDGSIQSRLLSGFRLPVELFWRMTPPSGAELLALAQAMVG